MKLISRFAAPFLAIVGLVLLCLGNPLGILLFLAGALLTGFKYQAALCAFPSNCNGRIINVSASNGCTLTRANILGLTPQAFENFGFTEIGMDNVYAKAREARLAGYQENTLMMLLNSRIQNIKGALTKQNVPGSQSVILPYFPYRQKRNINSNYWAIASGSATPGAGGAGIHPGSWDVVVQNDRSPLGNTLQNLEQYFLNGKTMFIEYSDATTGVPYSPVYVITGAATAGATTTVTIVPNYSPEGWLALTAAQKLVYQIGGLAGGNAASGTTAYLGVNSVSDFESWGGQDNAENTNSLLEFFFQTSRIVHEYSDEYLKALNDALTSNYFKIFRQLPLAEQKRIQRYKYDRDMLNSAFFGQRINEYQTVETYRQLPKVMDPQNPSCVLEYKANAVGFQQQLADCSRVSNYNGTVLSMDTLLGQLYLVKRAREADGTEIDTIDCMTDRFTSGIIQEMFIKFYKARYGVETQRWYEPNKELVFDNQVYLTYNVYQIPPEFGGFRLAVFSHPFFDDKLSAMTGLIDSRTASGNRGRTMWFLDWTDIVLGILGTNSAVRRTNDMDALFNYVIKINYKHITLDSMMWAPIIEDTNRHLIVQGFSQACPTITISPGCNFSETGNLVA